MLPGKSSSAALFAAATAALVSSVSAQTFSRTAACPSLGCVFPPDQTQFIPGQAFDIRIESQAPVNGSEAMNGGVVKPNYYLQIGKKGEELKSVDTFFGSSIMMNETSYNFTYYEDLFAEDAGMPTVVNAKAKQYYNVALYDPGNYTAKLVYDDGNHETLANWEVLDLKHEGKKAKNVIFFVGDGMTTNMITAARLLAHKTVNGMYQSKLMVDGAPGYGSQMTHSLDSFITDSANSATAMYSGHKATVNGLNAYDTSEEDTLAEPKWETTFEMFRRILGGQVGAVSTAYITDATPAATISHSSLRYDSAAIVEQYLHGIKDFPWFNFQGMDVLLGGGAEDFLPSEDNNNSSMIDNFASAGYSVVHTNTSLQDAPKDERLLGLFCQSNLPTWLDRNVLTDNLASFTAWDGSDGVTDVPGLKEMTLKAVEVLSARAKNAGTGFMLMSEAASIDKQMHALDYDRALGDLLELDDTLRATVEKLEALGELDDTLIILTADHGHGFDVFGSTDSKYLAAQSNDRMKRRAVGTYRESGLSAYTVPEGVSPQNQTIFVSDQGPGFPVSWDPRYTLAQGVGGFPDHRENYTVHPEPRTPAVEMPEDSSDYYANPDDAPNGFLVNGTLPIDASTGVHSLTDVPVYAWGPGHELFRGVHNSIDLAFNIARAVDLGRNKNVTASYSPSGKSKRSTLSL